MLVCALRLRHRGERLGPAELRDATPLIGLLRYDASHYKGRDGRGALVCLLMPPGESTQPLVQLFSARVRLIDHRGIIIQGIEEEWRRKNRTDHRQALWCWPIHPEALRPAAPVGPDAIDLEDERRALAGALR